MSSELTFGVWLRQRRSETGVTQEELSNKVGFSLALLRKLESAERRPSGQITNLLADYFHIPGDEREAFMAFARTGGVAPTSAYANPPIPADNDNLHTPWRLAYLRLTNLPASLTPIIGRDREKNAAREHLLKPKTRLFTLTGSAGIGKTRLGLEVASSLVESFEDGVFMVDLAPILDPELVLGAIARTLGMQETGKQSFETVLLDYLRGRRILLFLDNFEQVLDAATAIVRLLEASPWLKILITSREVLHVRGERHLSVPPLGLPIQLELGSPEGLETYPAVELFVERARTSVPEFELTKENAGDVAAICRGLEGVPLAIELAAARVRHFSPEELHSGLSNRLKLLTGGARDLPLRHRTLRGAIEWSYNLLNEGEQALFRFAGLFVGGFTSEAADRLSLGEKTESSAALTYETLMALTDKNLLRPEKKETAGAEMRFGFLEAVREFAVEQLVRQGELEKARKKHAEYYLALAERAENHFTGPQYPQWGLDQIGWMDRLEADLDNIRVALDWFQAQTEAETKAFPSEEAWKNTQELETLQNGLRLAIALRRIWLARGHFTEGVQWLTSFLAKMPRPLPADLPGLRTTYATALAILGRLTTLKGNVEDVEPLLKESLSIATELEDKSLTALILLISGVVALVQSDYAAAHSFQLKCLALYRELGNKWGAAAVLQDLGNVELYQGNFTAASSLLEESLQLFREVGETFGASSVLSSLGSMAYAEKEYGKARTLWQESLQLRQKIGFTSELGYSLVMLGWVELREANYSEASLLLKEGLQLGQDIETVFSVYWGLVGLAALAQALNSLERAALLFGAAEALAKNKNINLSQLKKVELDREITTAQGKLTAESWNSNWSSGYTLAFEITRYQEETPGKLNKSLAELLKAVDAL